MAIGRKTGGRVKGSKNKARTERIARISESGLTPLEFMLNLLRDSKSSLEDKRWAAKEAAPYVHPRLASVEQKVSGELTMRDDGVNRPPRMTREEWLISENSEHVDPTNWASAPSH